MGGGRSPSRGLGPRFRLRGRPELRRARGPALGSCRSRHSPCCAGLAHWGCRSRALCCAARCCRARGRRG
eukprot:10629829-Alexandrium_andersonii.AAC.1